MPFQGLPRRPVQPSAAPPGDVGVHRLVGEGVVEGVLLSDVPKEADGAGLLKRFFNLLFVAVGEDPQVVEGKPLPQDAARLLQRLPSFRPAAGGPLGDGLAHAFGDFYLIQLPADPTSIPHEEVPAFDERLQHLCGEEGVALGVGVPSPANSSDTSIPSNLSAISAAVSPRPR